MEEIEKEESSMKKGWMVSSTSPRLSFSHDISQTELLPNDHHAPPPVINDFDFDFSTAMQQEPCSADELFSDGKILPLFLKTRPADATTSVRTTIEAKQSTRLKEIMMVVDEEENHEEQFQKKQITDHKRPFWMFGRSGSLGSSRTTTTTMATTTTATTKQRNIAGICPFRRSKSVGCSTTTAVKTKGKINSSSKIYYYSGMKSWSHGSDGVRISPVINLPRGGSTASYRSSSSNSNSNSNSNSSLFSYLLCKCSTKGMELDMRWRGEE